MTINPGDLRRLLDMPMRHTEALRYSRFERLHFWLLRRWPAAVGRRRLEAYDRDVAETKAAFAALKARNG